MGAVPALAGAFVTETEDYEHSGRALIEGSRLGDTSKEGHKVAYARFFSNALAEIKIRVSVSILTFLSFLCLTCDDSCLMCDVLHVSNA